MKKVEQTTRQITLGEPSWTDRRLEQLRTELSCNFPIIRKLPWGGWMLLYRDEIGYSIFRGAYYEQKQLTFVYRFLQTGMVFFDLGANQGIYSIVAAARAGKRGHVYAFEPVESEYSKLKRNKWLNLAFNLTIEKMAVGRLDGSADMFVCESQKAAYSSLALPNIESSFKITKMSVPIVRLDSYVETRGIERLDMIKMDVEGAEMDVVAGAGETISRYRPLIQCEFSDRRTEPWGYRSIEIAERLIDRGYRWFEATEDGLREHHAKEYYEYEDLIAVPKEKLSLIDKLLAQPTLRAEDH